MHLTPGVVHNFPKAVSAIDGGTLPQDCVEEQLC